MQAFLVDIYSRPRSEGSDEAEHIGMCYIYPDSIKQTRGSTSVPITSMKFQPIGTLTSEYEEDYENLLTFEYFQLIIFLLIQLLVLTWTSLLHLETIGLMIGRVWMLDIGVLVTHTPRDISKKEKVRTYVYLNFFFL